MPLLHHHHLKTLRLLLNKSPITLNTQYDIPYTAGYSKDGKTIYIDRKLPRTFTTSQGTKVDVYKYLTIHETIEKSALQKLNLSFNEAHQLALGAEERALENDQITLDEYYGFLGPHIQSNLQNFNPSNVPPDLDLKPYQEDHLTSILQKLHPNKLALHTSEPSKSYTPKN